MSTFHRELPKEELVVNALGIRESKGTESASKLAQRTCSESVHSPFIDSNHSIPARISNDSQ